MKGNKIVNSLTLTAIYCSYVVWDYFHHEMLERTVLKNMVWLAFRYPSGSFMYSWDLIILSPIFIGLLLLVIKKGFGLRSAIVFAILAVISGILL